METTEKQKSAIQQQTERLSAIYEMIESCRFRIDMTRESCERTFGKNKDGSIKCTDADLKYYTKYSNIIKRLKQSYNNQLKTMQTFKIK